MSIIDVLNEHGLNNIPLIAHKADYLKHGLSGTTDGTGTATAYTLTPNPALSAYNTYLKVTVIFDKTNTGALTLNISSKGAIGWKKQDGTDYAASDIKINTPYTGVYNGTSFLADSSAGASNYFGDGSDGALSTVGATNITSTLDGLAVIKNYTNLTINAGHLMTVTNRCKGLFIYVSGDCIINGTLSMTARGASAVGADASFGKLVASSFWAQEKNPILSIPIPAIGAEGGIGGTVNGKGGNGTAGVYGQFGGGGGGGHDQGTGGNGSTGTSFSGGSGGGGGQYATGNNGAANGGAGGLAVDGNGSGAGGGAGNPAGAGVSPGLVGTSGTGGLLILVVRGNLTIGASGIISSNGSNGGNAHSPGGASGGGSVIVLYGGTLNNTGTIQASGGIGGSGGYNGGDGGAGSTLLKQINK